MNPIISLPEDLRNKISAGEVVERPASVVKELLENSLDAGASEITIVIEKGGHQLIQVRDNGHGISPDGLSQAFQRYTTNKISNIDDLFNINTLGFRGEALASIASVSEISVASSIDEISGHQMSLVNGVTSDIKAAPPIGGTEITVRNLFYNTPARKKFLKGDSTESSHITQIVTQHALAYPQIHFTLINNGRKVIDTLQTDQNLYRIAELFGSELTWSGSNFGPRKPECWPGHVRVPSMSGWGTVTCRGNPDVEGRKYSSAPP